MTYIVPQSFLSPLSMNMTPLDPLGHMTIAVSNIKRSKLFYEKIFQKLGLRKLIEKEAGTGIAWEIIPGFSVWLKQAKIPDYGYRFHAPGLHHLCFKVNSKQEVDEFYTFLLKEKVMIYDPPALYTKYTPDYYAVFFADPEGIKLEVAYY